MSGGSALLVGQAGGAEQGVRRLAAWRLAVLAYASRPRGPKLVGRQ